MQAMQVHAIDQPTCQCHEAWSDMRMRAHNKLATPIPLEVPNRLQAGELSSTSEVKKYGRECQGRSACATIHILKSNFNIKSLALSYACIYSCKPVLYLIP